MAYMDLRELFVLGKFEATDPFKIYQEPDHFNIHACMASVT